MLKKEKQIKELLEKYKLNRDTDIVMAGTNYIYIERQNQAFARGWRWAMKNIIDDLEYFSPARIIK